MGAHVTDAPVFTVQEVVRRTGLSDATLRYYERIGLVADVARDPSSGHRRYDAATVETLESLACLRSAGMSVADMRRYRLLSTRGDEAAGEQSRLFRRQADRLTTEIEALTLRLRYLELKAEFWQAREDGDAEREAALHPQLVAVVEQF